MEFKERVLKIIDTYENGVKSHFAAKTGIQNQIYNLLKPGYKPRKITIDKITTAYPNISAKWLTSDIGDMTTDTVATQPKEEKATPAELPEHSTPHQVLSYILKYSGAETLAKLSVKLNVKLSALNLVYNGTKPMNGRLAQTIHKAFPELPYQWIKTGESSLSKPKKRAPRKQNPAKVQAAKEAPVVAANTVAGAASVKTRKTRTKKAVADSPVSAPALASAFVKPAAQPADNQSYIQALELQMQSILKINEGLLSGYQNIIAVNQQLNKTIIELTDKVIKFNSK